MDASGDTTGNGVGQTWSGRTNGARTVYAHDNNNLTSYGYLYNWYAASDSRRICPTGWHVSTDSEWTNLTTYLGGESVAGDKLKELGTIYWSSTTGSGTNESGFSARGGGARSGSSNDGLFDNLRFLGVFWTATEANSTLSWRRILQANQVNALRTGTEKYRGFSIRCLKD